MKLLIDNVKHGNTNIGQ